AVVIGDEIDLAAVDAAFGVDLLEVGFFGLADHAIGRRGPRIRHDVADLDFGIAGAGVVFLLSEGWAACRSEQCEGSREGPHSQLDSRHSDLPGSLMIVCLWSQALCGRWPALNTFCCHPATKSPLRRGRRGLVF